MTANNGRVRVGLVAGGLGAYWPQFPGLLPQLRRSAERVSERMGLLGAEVVDAGFVSDAQEGAAAAEKLRAAGCDIIVGFLTTYMTATMLVPVAQRSGATVELRSSATTSPIRVAAACETAASPIVSAAPQANVDEVSASRKICQSNCISPPAPTPRVPLIPNPSPLGAGRRESES